MNPNPTVSALAFQPKRASFVLMAIAFVLVGWLHLTIFMLTGLFSYFVLEKLEIGNRKWTSIGLFIILIAAAGYGAFAFGRTAVVTLPRIVEESIPNILAFADSRGLELPEGYDYEAIKQDAVEYARGKLGNVGKFGWEAVQVLLALVIGVVVSMSLYLNTRVEPDADPVTGQDNLYSQLFIQIVARFRTFYRSFERVMGAQLVISLINSILTTIFLIWNGFPYAPVLAGLTFLLGLLPIVGNLVSNTLIVSVGFTIAPKMAAIALIFLIVIHKLEYFLNSKIIGDRIKNPMWLTLIGLIIGEKLMGIPGMILAPAVLHYVKIEASKWRVEAAAERTGTYSAVIG